MNIPKQIADRRAELVQDISDGLAMIEDTKRAIELWRAELKSLDLAVAAYDEPAAPAPRMRRNMRVEVKKLVYDQPGKLNKTDIARRLGSRQSQIDKALLYLARGSEVWKDDEHYWHPRESIEIPGP